MIKKLIGALAAMGLLAGLLGACGPITTPSSNNSSTDSPAETLGKTEQIDILDGSGTVLRTLSGSEEINAFFDTVDLDADRWDLPNSSKTAGNGPVELEFVFRQTPTETVLGGKPAEGELVDLIRLALYEGSDTAEFSLGVFRFSVELSDSARETLRGLADPEN